MNQGYTETITARVKPRTKALIRRYGISPRLVFERGLATLIPEDALYNLEVESLKDRLRVAKAEVVMLEDELEELKVNSPSLLSSED